MTGTDLIEKIDYGFLTNFDPSLFKKELAQVDAIKDLAIKLKDQSILRRAAWYRASKVAQAVDYYKSQIKGQGQRTDLTSDTAVGSSKSSPEVAAELGFSDRTIQRWVEAITRPDGSIDGEEYAKSLLEAWLIAADIIERAVKEGSGGGGGGGGADEVEVLWRAIEKRPEPIQRKLYVRLDGKFGTKVEKPKNNKALPKPDYDEDDFTGIVAKPADHRVTKAIEFFFEGVPVNKRLWVQQRMEEQETTLKGEGPHIEWIKAYWASDPEVQSAIKEGIKLENTKRMEG